MKLPGKIKQYTSKVDGQSYPYAICATDATDTPKPLIVEVSPGGFGNLQRCVEVTETIAGWVIQHGESCVVLRPTGRGNGSMYQHYGEIDVFEAIEDAKNYYPIDLDRISVTGLSMGGAATWYLISHYPDYFSAAAPIFGYCDYRLWEKPGGYINHMNDWEEPAWISKSAVFLLENLRYTPVWIVHGEWDRAIMAGVPVEQSRQMARLLKEQGYEFKYTEVPRADHDEGCSDEVRAEVMLWLLKQRKNRQVDHVVHSAFSLRHNASHWVSIEKIAKYGLKATIDARRMGNNKITVTTENINAFALSFSDMNTHLEFEIDGVQYNFSSIQSGKTFSKNNIGQWQIVANQIPGGKRPKVSGPIGDIFFDNTLLVQGTSGTEEEIYFMKTLMRVVPVHYRRFNGGVHRGTITGENNIELQILKDSELSENLLKQNNLILFGTHSSNRILARFAADLPISFHENTIRLYDKEYSAEYCTVFAIFPHPFNPERYVAVHGGVKADSIIWGTHLHMQLLPDYLVYSKGNVIDWGFVDNEWKIQPK